MDLYWEMGKLQKNNGALEQYKETNEQEVGDWEKKLMGHIKKGKDN